MTESIPPEIEKQLEIYERQILDNSGPEALSIFDAIARNYLYAVLSGKPLRTEIRDGWKWTYADPTPNSHE